MKPASILTVVATPIAMFAMLLASVLVFAMAQGPDWMHPGLPDAPWISDLQAFVVLGSGFALALGQRLPARWVGAAGAAIALCGHALTASHLAVSTWMIGLAAIAFGTGAWVPAAVATVGAILGKGRDGARLGAIVLTMAGGLAGISAANAVYGGMVRHPIPSVGPPLLGAVVAGAAGVSLLASFRDTDEPAAEGGRPAIGVAVLGGLAIGIAAWGYGDIAVVFQQLPLDGLLGVVQIGALTLGLAAAVLVQATGLRPPLVLSAGVGAALIAVGNGVAGGTTRIEGYLAGGALVTLGAVIATACTVALVAGYRRATPLVALAVVGAPAGMILALQQVSQMLGVRAGFGAASLGSLLAAVALVAGWLAYERPFEPSDAFMSLAGSKTRFDRQI